eukprot:GDKJ01027663.1.p1 GENE.GDKJ01027663.1~~GDKJ01027663.1.p1  ORF type:complete len:732 (-),score=135.91 GDKJ01027663.1:85-2163(-)
MEQTKVGASFLQRSRQNSNRLYVASIICLIFTITEFVGAWMSGSLALLADGAHMFSDLVAYMIAILAIWFSKRRGTSDFTFGYHRAEIVGAFVSVLIIWGVTIMLVIEAIERFNAPPKIDGKFMAIIAGLGVISNIFITFVVGMHGHGLEVHDHAPGGNCSGHNHGQHYHRHDSRELDTPCTSHDHSHDHHNYQRCNHSQKQVSNHVGCSKKCEHEHHSDDDDTSPLNRKASVSAVLLVGVEEGDVKREQDDASPVFKASAVDEAKMSLLKKKKSRSELISSPSLEVVPPSSSCSHSHGREGAGDINMHAAYLHAMTDILQNLGVLIAALFIWLGGDKFLVMDLICTLLFSFLILWSTFSLTKQIVRILMEASPPEISSLHITEDLIKLNEKIVAVEDVHIWTITLNRNMFSCRLLLLDASDGNFSQRILREATLLLQRKYNLSHSVIQIEQFKHLAAESGSCAAILHAEELGSTSIFVDEKLHALCYLPTLNENLTRLLSERRHNALKTIPRFPDQSIGDDGKHNLGSHPNVSCCHDHSNHSHKLHQHEANDDCILLPPAIAEYENDHSHDGCCHSHDDDHHPHMHDECCHSSHHSENAGSREEDKNVHASTRNQHNHDCCHSHDDEVTLLKSSMTPSFALMHKEENNLSENELVEKKQHDEESGCQHDHHENCCHEAHSHLQQHTHDHLH